MALATFKDLCVDAVDPDRLAPFWARALGRTVGERRDDGLTQLVGPTPRHTVWINPVPEPVTVKQRVHLDVHAASVDDVLALGATPDDLESFRWKVLRDPEGGELCVFEREQVREERLYEIVVDAAEPERVARWWAEALGAGLRPADDGSWYLLAVPGAPFEHIVFGPVPEPKTVKNRIHWDVDAPDVARLVDRGARVLREPDHDIRWTVLADPEGNEFCVFPPTGD